MEKFRLILAKLFLIFSSIVAGVIFLIIAFLLYLQTDHAKGFITSQLNKHVNSELISLDVETIESFWPLSVSISYLALKDPALLESQDEPSSQGDTSSTTNPNPSDRWLSLKDIKVNFDVNDLFSTTKRSVTAEVSIRKTALYALPPSKESSEPSEPFDLKETLEDIKETVKETLPIDVDILVKLDQIKVDQSIAGQPIEASLSPLTLSFRQSDHHIDANIKASTASFGEPLVVLLQLQGPLDNFETAFALKTKRVSYNGIELKNVNFNGGATGLPLNIDATFKGVFSHNDIKGFVSLDSLTLKETVITLKGLVLKGLDANINADGHVDVTNLSADGNLNLAIADLAPISQLIAYPMTGSLKLTSKVTYSESTKEASANLNLVNFSSKDAKVSKAKATLSATDISMIPSGTLNLNATGITVAGQSIETVSLNTSLDKGKGDVALNTTGKDIVANLKTKISLTEKEQVFDVVDLNAIYMNQPIRATNPFQIKIQSLFAPDNMGAKTEDSVAPLDVILTPLTLKIATFPIQIQGELKGDELNASAKGDADLGVLSRLFLYSGDVVEGILSMDVSAKGPISEPKIQGLVSLEKGFYGNAEWGTKLRNLTLKAVADTTKVKIETAKATDGFGGELNLSGSYDIDQNAMDITLSLVDFRLAYTDFVQVEGREANITAKGPLTDLNIKGRLKTGDIYYNITKTFAGDVPTLNVIDPTKPNTDVLTGEKKVKKKVDDSAPKITLDVDIEIPPTVEISGLGIESVWGGDLSLKGTLDDLLILGNIDAKSGSITFIGSDIEIEEGSLKFDGHENNLPYLALQAGLQKQDFKAIISLSGRANKPTFVLKSEPSLPQDEILAKLLFGSESKQLSPFDAIKLARIAAELGGLKSGASFSSVMKSSKASTEEEEDASGPPELDEDGNPIPKKKRKKKSKKRFSDYVNVSFDTGVTPEDSKVVVDVKVSPRVTVSSETGVSDSTQAVGVKYSWDY